MSTNEKSVTYILVLVEEESGEKDGVFPIASSDVRENLMDVACVAPVVDAALCDRYGSDNAPETFAHLFSGQTWTKRNYSGYSAILEQKNYASTYCPFMLAIAEVPKI